MRHEDFFLIWILNSTTFMVEYISYITCSGTYVLKSGKGQKWFFLFVIFHNGQKLVEKIENYQ